MRLIFMGSPNFAIKSLEKLNQHHCVVGVYTQPPRPAGRGMKQQKTAVAEFADAHNIPCFCPASLSPEDEIKKLKQTEADIFIVVAYGLILSQAVLDIPKFGCINGHASLLPRWRGAAPIQRAIEAGDKQTGVTAMQMERGLDTGPMLHSISTAISKDDTSLSLHDRLAELTAKCLLETLELIIKDTLTPLIQPDEGICYAHKITKSETALDLRQSAEQLDYKIRAFSPSPSCWLPLINGNRIKIIHAEVADFSCDLPIGSVFLSKSDNDFGICVADGQILIIRQLQPAGKTPMTGAAYVNGYNLRHGDIIWAI